MAAKPIQPTLPRIALTKAESAAALVRSITNLEGGYDPELTGLEGGYDPELTGLVTARACLQSGPPLVERCCVGAEAERLWIRKSHEPPA